MSQNPSERPPRRTFDTAGAAAYVGCSPGHLKKLRWLGGGPVFSRLFVRKGIVYEQEDLDEFKAKRRYGSTTEYPETLP